MAQDARMATARALVRVARHAFSLTRLWSLVTWAPATRVRTRRLALSWIAYSQAICFSCTGAASVASPCVCAAFDTGRLP